MGVFDVGQRPVNAGLPTPIRRIIETPTCPYRDSALVPNKDSVAREDQFQAPPGVPELRT